MHSLSHPSRRGSRQFAVLPLLLFVAGCAVFARAALVAAGEPAPTPVGVEEVRIAVDENYVLERHVFFAPNAQDTAATADALAGPSAVSPGGASAAFVVNNHLWAAGAMPVLVYYNGSSEPDGLGVAAVLQTELQTWSSTGASFAFAYGGANSEPPGACEGATGNRDGSNTIAFVSTLPNQVLGQTCTISARGGSQSALMEFDMQIAIDIPWVAGQTNPRNTYDLPSTMLHELGHAAGLGHSSVRSAVMYASLANGEQKRTLTADDIAAINAAYPPPPGSAPTPAPVPTPANIPAPVFERNFIIKAPAVARD